MSAGSPTLKAAVVLPCQDLDATLGFFLDRLGFRLDTVFPADDPAVAVISGHGARLRLERGSDAPPATLRLPRSVLETTDEAEYQVVAPNGTRVFFVESDIPEGPGPAIPELLIQRHDAGSGADSRKDGAGKDGAGKDEAWNDGRAGMRYRDLIPGRWNGHFIASHIQIPLGGPVPDYVHYHDVRFQMIYCHRGWVRVAYQDQGDSFAMHPGDCVLQPPGIRHRVLEASDGLEVIEIGCPALHATHVDHALSLPSALTGVDGTYGGQRFSRHLGSRAVWEPWHLAGFEARDLGIAAATNDRATAVVARANLSGAGGAFRHPGGFQFIFILAGAVALNIGDREDHRLAAGDAATIPPGRDVGLVSQAVGTEILEVSVSPEIFSH